MINIEHLSACLITKDKVYPKKILDDVSTKGFGEILILANCDSPHRKQELFEKAKFDYVYYQDDDCIAPIDQLILYSRPNIINCAMKEYHLGNYAASRIALLGWGSIFPKSVIKVLDIYRKQYGEDEVYKRETERIMTYFSFPQNRMLLPIRDLPSADDGTRLSDQPGHYDYIKIVDDRCRKLL